MISLHRLGHQAEEFHLNPDLIVTVEANPDTVITLTTGTKIVVAEPPERVVDEIQQYVSRSSPERSSAARRAAQPHGVQARRAAQGMLRLDRRGERARRADEIDPAAEPGVLAPRTSQLPWQSRPAPRPWTVTAEAGSCRPGD